MPLTANEARLMNQALHFANHILLAANQTGLALDLHRAETEERFTAYLDLKGGGNPLHALATERHTFTVEGIDIEGTMLALEYGEPTTIGIRIATAVLRTVLASEAIDRIDPFTQKADIERCLSDLITTQRVLGISR